MKKGRVRAARSRVKANGDLEDERTKICKEIRWIESEGRKGRCFVKEHSV